MKITWDVETDSSTGIDLWIGQYKGYEIRMDVDLGKQIVFWFVPVISAVGKITQDDGNIYTAVDEAVAAINTHIDSWSPVDASDLVEVEFEE
jgi:hypothetical protein